MFFVVKARPAAGGGEDEAWFEVDLVFPSARGGGV